MPLSQIAIIAKARQKPYCSLTAMICICSSIQPAPSYGDKVRIAGKANMLSLGSFPTVLANEPHSSPQGD